MSDAISRPERREFHCSNCNGAIAIPYDLPPTTAPCPHCGTMVTSPAPVAPVPPQEVPQPPPAAELPSEGHRKMVEHPAGGKSFAVWGIVLAALLLGLIALGVVSMRYFGKGHRKEQAAAAAAAPSGTAPKQDWEVATTDVLRKFLAAKTVEGKLSYAIPLPGLKERMENFYGGVEIDDGDTPVGSFTGTDSMQADRKRGIYLQVFDQPAGVRIRDFFAPIAPRAVTMGIERPSVLAAIAANPENYFEEPLSVMAFFVKTPEGYKIDWDTFVQTKYGTFENFLTSPEIGQTGVFRVAIIEDVPERGAGEKGSRTYSLISPEVRSPMGRKNSSARVQVPTDSDLGKELAPLNWRGIPGRETTPPPKTATVELKWSKGNDSGPKLEISRLVCWEFLGVGGVPGAPLAPAVPPQKDNPPKATGNH